METVKAYLYEKYGKERYDLNSYWLDLPLDELEDEFTNFTCDYYGAFADLDFLTDVIIWKRKGEIKNG